MSEKLPQSERDIPEPPEKLLSLEAVRQAWQMPWKAQLELWRLAMVPRNWLGLRFSGVNIGTGWRFYGVPIWQIHRQSSVHIGNNMNLRSSIDSNPLGIDRAIIISARVAGAKLSIGDDFGMTGGSIVCEEQIEIGDRVFVGANSIIVDTDFHPLNPIQRIESPLAGKTSPVKIEDDVFIGMRCMILKGTHIGAGAVIGAGSVVTGDIPAGLVVAGNPARIIREVE